MTLFHLHFRERMAALALLLILLAVLTGVGLSQAGLLDRQADTLEDVALPALRRVHDVQRLVDASRGLEALHLLAGVDGERSLIEQQLRRQRELVQGRLVLISRRAADEQERALHERVQQQATRYWALQDQVLAASRLAAVDPTRQPEARALLAGASQAAWRELGQALADWMAYQERRAAAIAQHSRSQAQWLRLSLATGLGLLTLLCLGALVRRQSFAPDFNSPFVASRPAPEDDRLPSALDDIATQSRLVALNAAVQAARHGEPSSADMAERSRLAAEAEVLATRCDAARRDLRAGLGRRRKPVKAD